MRGRELIEAASAQDGVVDRKGKTWTCRKCGKVQPLDGEKVCTSESCERIRTHGERRKPSPSQTRYYSSRRA